MGIKSNRQYNSPARKQQADETRHRILSVARQLFVAEGYVSTTVARIAAEAGVSPQTVYNSVGGKAAILLALNDLVDESGGVEEIQLRIAESENPHEIVALTALLRRRLMEGAGDVVNLLAETAAVNDEVARVWEDGKARSSEGVARVVARLASLGALRPDMDVDTLTESASALLHHGLWTRLVEEAGWTPDAFEAWCSELLERMLLDPED